MDRTHDDAAMRALLAEPRKIAMLGASDNPARPSHGVFRYLIDQGHDVVPVNPVAKEVHGIKTVPDLAGAVERFGGPPDIVDVFRAPDHLPAIVPEVLKSGARWLWLQLGVVHDEAIAQALEGDLEVVVDRCIKVEAARLT